MALKQLSALKKVSLSRFTCLWRKVIEHYLWSKEYTSIL